MVKMTRMGETDQMKSVVCVEIITLRQMEHVVVVEKIPVPDLDPRRGAWGGRAF